MSLEGIMFSLISGRSDRKRDAAIALPAGVTECRNIAYGSHGEQNLLDVYTPTGTVDALPTIVSIHGGGFVYGNKEIYRRYGMDMAARGFAFVNFNYRLAPKWKFPTPLEDVNHVMQWICCNAKRYHLDPSRIILLGDSAGAQMTSQYATIWSNKDYAAHFHMTTPEITIRVVGLFCGMYDTADWRKLPRKGLLSDYLGRKLDPNDPRIGVLENITPAFPPAFLATSCHDFLRENAQPMCDFLHGKGIAAECKCYGSEERTEVSHVFHVNIRLPEAKECNDDAAAFFRQYV